MVHKIYQTLGEKVTLIADGGSREGIFQKSYLSMTQECRSCDETIKVVPNKSVDFIQPLYASTLAVEETAKGDPAKERVDPANPILRIYHGMSVSRLRYFGKTQEGYFFEGELHYADTTYINDGNEETFDKYRKRLKKAGFKVK